MICPRALRRATASLLALALSHCTQDVELLRAPRDAEADTPDAPDVTDGGAPDVMFSRWIPVPSGTSRDLKAIWGTRPDDIWAVGDNGTALHWNGAGWRDTPTNVTTTLTGVWASAPNDAWTVGMTPDGDQSLLHWDGARWTPVILPSRNRAALRAIWGSGPGDVWAIGTPTAPEVPVWHWDGIQWRPEFTPGPRPTNLSALGGGPDDLWVIGQNVTLFHRTMNMWSAVQPPRTAPVGASLCVASDRALWTTSATNVIYRYVDPVWTPYTLRSMTAARGLWCDGAIVWAVGDGGQIARWNGAAWSSQPAPRANLAALWGTRDGELWAVGTQGSILRYLP